VRLAEGKGSGSAEHGMGLTQVGAGGLSASLLRMSANGRCEPSFDPGEGSSVGCRFAKIDNKNFPFRRKTCFRIAWVARIVASVSAWSEPDLEASGWNR
jgi:hypothetical protein